MPDENELHSFAMSEAILSRTSEAIFSRWARLFSQRRITISMIQSGPYWDRKTWTLIVLSKVLGNCAFRWYLNRMQFEPEGSYDVSIQMG
jgi:hypothetical protein